MKRLYRNRKGFFKIIEAVLAITLAMLFLLYIIPYFSESEPLDLSQDLFGDMRDDEIFRSCVAAENKTCINETFLLYNHKFDGRFDYKISFEGEISLEGKGLPEKDVMVESYYYAGNYTAYGPKILKISYWNKD